MARASLTVDARLTAPCWVGDARAELDCPRSVTMRAPSDSDFQRPSESLFERFDYIAAFPAE
jgi:hypothetical protein